MPAGNPRLAPALWDALRRTAAPASVAELQRVAGGFRHHHFTARLRRWEALGLVEALPAEPVRFVFAPGAPPAPPTSGALSADGWAALRRLGRPTYAELLAATGATDRSLYCRLFRWIEAGHVVRILPVAERFALTPAGRDVAEPPATPTGPRPRRIRTARARVWSAMRILKTFDVPLLVMTAEVNRRACEELISALGRAGYIETVSHRVTRHRAGANGFARDYSTYRLVRATGPKCPVVSCPAGGGRRLFDPNTGETFDLVARQRRAEVNHVA